MDEIAHSINSIIAENSNIIARANSDYYDVHHRRLTAVENAKRHASLEAYNRLLLEQRIADVAARFTANASFVRPVTEMEHARYDTAYNAIISSVFTPPDTTSTTTIVLTPAGHIMECKVTPNGAYAMLVNKIVASATKKHIPVKDVVKLLDMTYKPFAKKIDKLNITNNKTDLHTFLKLYENIIDILFSSKKTTPTAAHSDTINSNGHRVKTPAAITRLRNVF